MQHTAPQVHFLVVLQCSSWCRDRNTTTAIYRNAAGVNYECIFIDSPYSVTQLEYRVSMLATLLAVLLHNVPEIADDILVLR